MHQHTAARRKDDFVYASHCKHRSQESFNVAGTPLPAYTGEDLRRWVEAGRAQALLDLAKVGIVVDSEELLRQDDVQGKAALSTTTRRQRQLLPRRGPLAAKRTCGAPGRRSTLPRSTPQRRSPTRLPAAASPSPIRRAAVPSESAWRTTAPSAPRGPAPWLSASGRGSARTA